MSRLRSAMRSREDVHNVHGPAGYVLDTVLKSMLSSEINLRL
jgi:hypothetical protein